MARPDPEVARCTKIHIRCNVLISGKLPLVPGVPDIAAFTVFKNSVPTSKKNTASPLQRQIG
jgi:hypothetical protein